MISYLSGKVKNISEKTLTILTVSGVGYSVFSPINTLFSFKIDDEIEMLIHTVVKDDAIDLYGFTNEGELQMFEKLITVSGVGPRSALNILSVSSTQNIAIAVENGDANLLSGIPGVGKKSCEKIVIELKGKLSKFIVENRDVNNKNNLLEEYSVKLVTRLIRNAKMIITQPKRNCIRNKFSSNEKG